MKRTALLRHTPMKPYRRKPDDRVPDWLPGYLYARDDASCIPARLGAPDPCRGRLTIEHFKDTAMTGKRAPIDKRHTLLACEGHNLGWCLLSASKQAERDYLARVEPAA